MTKHHQWTVEGGAKSLMDFLFEQLSPNLSKKQIQGALDLGGCRVNGRLERFRKRGLKRGDRVELHLRSPQKKIRFEKERVLYQDAHLLFYHKPSGISTDGKGLHSLLQATFPQLKMVHRLDKETSGVLLFALSEEGEKGALEAFRSRKVKKEYVAFVRGIPSQAQGRCVSFLAPVGQMGTQKIWGKSSSAQGKRAVTDWVRWKQGHGVAGIRCFPLTGRTHQIRVHLSEMGYPILGDLLYGRGKRESMKVERCLLHAHRLELFHPLEKEKKLMVTAPLPRDMQEVLEKLDAGSHC